MLLTINMHWSNSKGLPSLERMSTSERQISTTVLVIGTGGSGLRAAIEFFLARRARREQLLAAGLELAMELGYEPKRFRTENFGESRRNRARNGDALRKRSGHVHRSILLRECGTAT